jgi:hypothetical protein
MNPLTTGCWSRVSLRPPGDHARFHPELTGETDIAGAMEIHVDHIERKAFRSLDVERVPNRVAGVVDRHEKDETAIAV